MDDKQKNDHGGSVQEFELAGLIERLAANLIDSFLLLLPLLIAAVLLASGGRAMPRQLLQFVFMAIPVAYHWYFWTRRDGQTPGKFALGIRVIKTDGSPINDVDALIRAIGYNVSAMLFGFGFIWAFFNAKNQTWHDLMARTYVVRSDERRKTVEILP
jgi:uncharacterized RDD family membrane protein YckC